MIRLGVDAFDYSIDEVEILMKRYYLFARYLCNFILIAAIKIVTLKSRHDLSWLTTCVWNGGICKRGNLVAGNKNT